MGKTRRGVYYELNETEYRYTLRNVTYYFSSKNHLEKFKERFDEENQSINYMFKRRYGIKFNFDILSDLLLYKKVETRGFLIEIEGVRYKCLEQVHLELGLGRAMLKE